MCGFMTGDIAAITCAAFFAFCSIAFAGAGRIVGSMVVNQTRILLAAVFLVGLHVAVEGEVWPSAMSMEQGWWIVLSGVVGLALGDLFYFHSLAVLGPRLGTLLMATFPVFVVFGDGFVRGRWPGWLDGIFMTAIVLGVMVVLTGKKGEWRGAGGRRWVAVVAGVLGAVGQGAGIVIVKMAGDVATAGDLDPLSITLVRMIAGLIGMAVIRGAQRPWRETGAAPRRMSSKAFWLILVGVVFGPTLGVWLSMVAVDLIEAARAAVLIALTPVLMLPIVWIGWGERPTLRGWVGTVAAFAGTAALLAGRS
jgi:drug/metabolite transporter (DMT)-like permease